MGEDFSSSLRQTQSRLTLNDSLDRDEGFWIGN
jgi:hypothetical protein